MNPGNFWRKTPFSASIFTMQQYLPTILFAALVLFLLSRIASKNAAISRLKKSAGARALSDAANEGAAENPKGEEILNRCLKFALNSRDERETYDKITETIGSALNADRCYVYTLDNEKRLLKNHSLWCAPGVTGEALIELTPEHYAATTGRLKSDGEIRLTNTAVDKSDVARLLRRLFKERGIRAMLLKGIFEAGELRGLIGVGFVKGPHHFSGFESRLLGSAASIIEVFMQRRRAAEETEQSEAEKRMILESLELPVMLFDASPKLLFVNSAAAAMTGKSAGEILKEPCYANFCGRSCVDENCNVLRAIRTGMPQTFEASHHGQDFVVKIFPIRDKSGKIVNALEYHVNVTEFNKKSRELMKALSAAKAADRAKTQFLATMSHEIRTPLNAVIGYSELSLDDSLEKSERHKNLKNIGLSARSLLSLFNDVLDLSMLETHQLEIKRTPVDIRALVDELRQLFAFRAISKRIRLNVGVSESFPVLMLDGLRLRQAVMNLLGNAIKFTDTGGVDVDISFEPAGADSGNLRISVKDTGTGIPHGILDTIFNPFERHTSDKPRGDFAYDGTGMGLPISKRLVEEMGGDIRVESEPGKGSTFTITLRNVSVSSEAPRETPAQAAVREAESAAPASPPKPFDGEVVIIDDIAMNLNILGAILKKLNIKYSAYLSGKEAYEGIKSKKPSVILTDLWMPEMTGMELAKIVKENPETADIPVVAITADSQFKIKEYGEFSDIVLKPISLKEISGVIEGARNGNGTHTTHLR